MDADQIRLLRLALLSCVERFRPCFRTEVTFEVRTYTSLLRHGLSVRVAVRSWPKRPPGCGGKNPRITFEQASEASSILAEKLWHRSWRSWAELLRRAAYHQRRTAAYASRRKADAANFTERWRVRAVPYSLTSTTIPRPSPGTCGFASRSSSDTPSGKCAATCETTSPDSTRLTFNRLVLPMISVSQPKVTV